MPIYSIVIYGICISGSGRADECGVLRQPSMVERAPGLGMLFHSGNIGIPVFSILIFGMIISDGPGSEAVWAYICGYPSILGERYGGWLWVWGLRTP